MTKEEKLVEFIKRTTYELCKICKKVNNEKCDDVIYGCGRCPLDCECKTCENGSGFVLDEKKLDEWTEKQK